MGRYESLDGDLTTALERAGVDRHLDIPRSNVTRGRKRDLAYQSYYTSLTRELVADWYAPEIALFGYVF